ncbi:MAG: MmcQ/YjbR family DNA-binding protein [Ferruginibacter sp.]
MNAEEMRAICKSLSSVKEDIKWIHDLVFSIGRKMFCVAGLGQSPTSAPFKVKEEEFEEICNRDGFKPAPYVDKDNWILIDDLQKMSKNDWKRTISQSYVLVKEKFSPIVKKQPGFL